MRVMLITLICKLAQRATPSSTSPDELMKMNAKFYDGKQNVKKTGTYFSTAFGKKI